MSKVAITKRFRLDELELTAYLKTKWKVVFGSDSIPTHARASGAGSPVCASLASARA